MHPPAAQRDLKVRRYLFQLCHVEQECAALRTELSASRASLATIARRQLIAEKEIGDKKKEAARLAKEALLADKRAAKAAAAAGEHTPAVEKAAEEATRVTKKLKAAEKSLSAAKAEAKRSATSCAKLKADVADVDAAAADAATAAAAEEAQGAFAALTPALEAEYAAAKSDAAMRTHSITVEIASEERAVAALRDVATASAQKLSEVDARLAALAAAAEEAATRRDALRASVDAAKGALAAAKTAAGAAADEHRRARLRGEHLDGQLREAEEKLAAERACRRDSERERRLADAVNTLSVSYRGVQGRLVDLIDVPNRRHRLAVTVALGRWADAVVTDNDVTARECIKHLKEQRLERLVFIPLANVRVQAVDERLRRLGGTATLAVDCVTPKAPGLERAIVHALGDTLLCDTHEEAKRVAFGDAERGERHKVVSLDGTLCARWGGITGGATGGSGGGYSEGGTRFDRVAYDALKAKVTALAAERAALPSGRDGAAREADAAAAVAAAQRALAALQGDAKATAERGAKAAAEREALATQRDKLAPDCERAAAALEARAAMVASLRARVAEISERVCRPFCDKVGATSLRQYEEAELAAKTRAADAAARFATQRAKLTQQLQYEEARDTAAPVAKLEATIAECGAAIEALGKTAAKAKAKAAEAEAAAEALRAEAATARAAAEAADTGISALSREVKTLTDEGSAAKRAASGKEAALAAAAERRAAALREAAVEALPLPRVGGAGAGDDDDDGDAMDVDPSAPGGSDDAGGAGPSGAAGGGHGGAIDFSSLPRALAAAAGAGVAGARERERLEASLRAEIEDKGALLEKLAPNLKAGHQYEAVKERERALADELEAAKAAARDATAAFAATRAERCAPFPVARARMHARTHTRCDHAPRLPALTHPFSSFLPVSCSFFAVTTPLWTRSTTLRRRWTPSTRRSRARRSTPWAAQPTCPPKTQRRRAPTHPPTLVPMCGSTMPHLEPLSRVFSPSLSLCRSPSCTASSSTPCPPPSASATWSSCPAAKRRLRRWRCCLRCTPSGPAPSSCWTRWTRRWTR
jgi:structural maintenance of chromosome 1